MNGRAGKGNRTTIKDAMMDGASQDSQENGTIGMRMFEDMPPNLTDEQAYCELAGRVRSIIDFTGVAYPDLVGGDALGKEEPLNEKDRWVCRSKLLASVERGLHGGAVMQEVVYDLDAIASKRPGKDCDIPYKKEMCNFDDVSVGLQFGPTRSLCFYSAFESGNLRKAIQVQFCERRATVRSLVHVVFYFYVSKLKS